MTYREDLRKRFNKMSQKKFIDSFHKDIPCEEKSSNSNYSPVSTAVRPAKRITTGQTKKTQIAKPNPVYSTGTQLPPLQKAPSPKVLPQHPVQPTAADSFPPFPGKTLEDQAKETMPDIEVKDKQDTAEFVNTKRYVKNSTGLFVPTKYDAVRFYKMPMLIDKRMQTIENEENASLLIPLALIEEIPFGIEGFAGTAKTALMDRTLMLLDGNDIYILTSASDKAIYYDQQEINTKKMLYFTEMQKCMNLTELVKTLAEGKDATHRVKIGGKTQKITIASKQVYFTRAYDNRWDLDKELRRRFLIIDSTTTPTETEEITKTILSNCHKILKKSKNDDNLVESLKAHLKNMRNTKDLLYFDPYADCLAEIIPTQNLRVKAYINHYIKAVHASAKFCLQDRMQFKYGSQKYVVIELADHYDLFRSFHKDFITVLKHFGDEDPANFDKYENVEVDWEKWAKTGYELMKNHEDAKDIRKSLPNFVEKWYGKQTKNNGIWTLDYKTGNEIKIADVPITEI